MDVIGEINALEAKNAQLKQDLSNGQLSDSVRDFKQKLILGNQRIIANLLALQAALIEKENRPGNFTSYIFCICCLYLYIHSFIRVSFPLNIYLFQYLYLLLQ